MDDLIEALQIFNKYIPEGTYGKEHPTTCEHDMLFVNAVRPDQVSEEDIKRLEELGFENYENVVFVSYRFGDN